jgi:glucose dehydrogenase
MFARDADSGQAVWFYQMSPHDLYDWDGITKTFCSICHLQDLLTYLETLR